MDDLARLTARLAANAGRHDRTTAWPADSMDALAEAGAWRWVIPRAYGGEQRSPVEILEGYEAVGRGCMNTLLILTQRDAAAELIATAPSEALRQRWLVPLARGEVLTTVGISQLTTSHQDGPPAMRATPVDSGYRLDGFMPWATAAAQCDVIVTGGVLPNGMQILVALPRERDGVDVQPPLRLMALEPSWTSRVDCRGVRVDHDEVIRGPVEKVLAMRSTVKPMVVSSAGLGLAGALVDVINEWRGRSAPEVMRPIEPLLERYEALRRRLFEVARTLGETGGAEAPSAEIRVEVNDVVVKLAAAALTLAKGAGYVAGHPLERLVREAMFFLVWSAPDNIRAATLARLLGG